MPNTKTNRDGLLVTENVRIFLMKTDGNGPGAAGKESVMNLLGMRSLGKIKEKGEKIMFWIELVIMLLLIFWGVRKGGVFLTLAGAVGNYLCDGAGIIRAVLQNAELNQLSGSQRFVHSLGKFRCNGRFAHLENRLHGHCEAF